MKIAETVRFLSFPITNLTVGKLHEYFCSTYDCWKPFFWGYIEKLVFRLLRLPVLLAYLALIKSGAKSIKLS